MKRLASILILIILTACAPATATLAPRTIPTSTATVLPTETPAPTLTPTVIVTATLAAPLETPTPAPTEIDQKTVEELAAGLVCRDARGCMVEDISSPKDVDVYMVSTGTVQTTRFADASGKELGTMWVAEMVTRSAKTNKPIILHTVLQVELDSEKGVNKFSFIAKGILRYKSSNNSGIDGSQIFPTEWWKQWFLSGSNWTFHFDKNGTMILTILQETEFTDPGYKQIVAEFLGSYGETSGAMEGSTFPKLLVPSGISNLLH